jgi:hypothetical protein
MSHVIILAGSRGEASAYMQHPDIRKTLPRGRAVIATSARAIEGVVPSEIRELPGFARRRDKHAILATIKRMKRRYQACEHVRVYDPAMFVEVDGVLTTSGYADAIRNSGYPNDERTHEVALRYNALREIADLGSDDPAETPDFKAVRAEVAAERRQKADTSNGDAMESEGAPVGKPRRSRCKDCGSMHFKGLPCPPPPDPAFFKS